MKPTLKIAMIRSPGHGARQWLQYVTQRNEPDCWRASFETEVNRYDFTIGMPPLSHPHAVLVLVDVKEGVTEILRRNLWHAKRRGIRHWFALLHHPNEDNDLFDVASLELRECMQSLGLDGNSLHIFTMTPEKTELAAKSAALYELFDAQLAYYDVEVFAQPDEQYRLMRLIRRLCFYETDTANLWRGTIWSYLCRGEEYPAQANRAWKLHSIMYQACCGYFDDVPDLLAVLDELRSYPDDSYFHVAFDLLGHIGTRELWPLIREAFEKKFRLLYSPDEFIFYAIRHWNYLSCVPRLRSLSRISRYSGAQELINDKIEQILGAKPWEDAPEVYKRVRAQFSEHQLLFLGKPFSLVEAAKHLLPQNRSSSFERNLTSMFMAQTGQLYDDRELNIFLQNRAASFQPEKRYFNGYEIPDFSQNK
jgi:hypothetical protein